MTVHVATLREFDVHSVTGEVVIKGRASTAIHDVLRLGKGWRIVSDPANPNTANYPDLKSYLDLEATDGYEIISLTPFQIVTSDAGRDPLSGANVSIGIVHAHIHDGMFYTASVFDAALADTADIEVLLQTNGGSPHVRFQVASGGDSTVMIFEGTTFSSAGAAVAAVNRNRYSANTATWTVTSAPTLIGDGTTLFSGFVPGGVKSHAGGGTGGTFEEWVFQTGTNYLVRVTNVSGSAQPVSLIMDWYEE